MTEAFGKTGAGQETVLYTLENKNGMQIAVSDYGATLVKVIVPDARGRKRDVVLGYDDAAGYEAGDKFFGATVGRVANRIGGASFELNGKTYELDRNDNGNNLHSGMDFYSKRMWTAAEYGPDHVTFTLHSPDGDQGYPGAVDLTVTYTLTEENEVRIHYHAVPDADTLLNMTNHSYFNLAGQDSGTILDQEVWIGADAYTEADAQSIPTGAVLPVEGTPMDFRVRKAIGRDIEADFQALAFGGGYDHNWALNGSAIGRWRSLPARRAASRWKSLRICPACSSTAAISWRGTKGKAASPTGSGAASASRPSISRTPSTRRTLKGRW